MIKKDGYCFYINKTGKKLVLKDYDMRVLVFLYEMKTLTSQQVADIYSFVLSKEVLLRTVRAKVTRYSAYGGILTKRIEQKKGAGYKRALYTLRENGIRFLRENGYIDSNSGDTIYSSRLSIHTIASREVATRTLRSLVNLSEKSLVQDVDIRSFFRQKNIVFGNNPYNFLPDQCISLSKSMAFIELDTGSENLDMILDKVQNYITYAEQTNERVGVFIVALDGSLFNPFTDSIPYGRLSNILFRLRKFHQKLMTLPNLHVYVSSLQVSGEVVAEFLLHRQYGEQEFIQSILEPLKGRTVGDAEWKYGIIKKVDGFTEEVDGACRRVNRLDENAYKDFYLVFGHENEYRSIGYLDDLIYSRIESDEYLNIPLVVLYPKRTKPRDIFLMSPYKDTFLFSIQNENVQLETDEKIFVRVANSIYPAKRTSQELY